MKVHVHVDTLVLEGLPEGAFSEADLRDAMAAELTSRFTAGPVPQTLLNHANRAEAAAPEVHQDGDAHSQTLGKQMGLAIYRGIRR
jgi:hypothetical protein